MMMYNTPFTITALVSNNTFSFDKRRNPEISVPKIIDGTIDDVQIGSAVAFEDFDEQNHLKSCVGLKNFIRTTHPKTGKPIIIVDNHNHVYWFWHEARQKGEIDNGATLVHIDQHKDSRMPESFLPRAELNDPEKIFRYTNTVLNVGNYIPAAQKDGLIKKIINITSEKEITLKSLISDVNSESEITSDINLKSVIVNLDLDFWAPEMDYIDKNLKNNAAWMWMEKADLITIATSPFFIDQKRAIKVLSGIMQP